MKFLCLVAQKKNRFREIISIEKYTTYSNEWETIKHTCDDRSHYTVCSFLGNVYVIGGRLGIILNSCFKFDPSNYSWTEVAEINMPRYFASRAVFEGRIVVSGGLVNNNHTTTKTVEAFEYIANSWEYMPSMIVARLKHKLLAIKNKLFVIAGSDSPSCEMYDSTCKNFVLIPASPKISKQYL